MIVMLFRKEHVTKMHHFRSALAFILG